jgi:hypothetical protein
LVNHPVLFGQSSTIDFHFGHFLSKADQICSLIA